MDRLSGSLSVNGAITIYQTIFSWVPFEYLAVIHGICSVFFCISLLAHFSLGTPKRVNFKQCRLLMERICSYFGSNTR